jgi:hypothetical protein
MVSSNKEKIIEEKLNGEFEMKDLSATKRMFGMNIVKNWDKDKLVLSRKWWSSLRCLML